MKNRSGFIGLACLLVLTIGGGYLVSCDNGNGGDSSSESTPTPTPTPTVVQATWTFNGGAATIAALPTATYTGSVELASDIVIASDDGGTGATFTLLSGSDNKPKYNTGIQQNTSGKTWDFAKITVDAGCTITLTGKAAGAYDAAKKRSVTLGDQSWELSATDNKDAPVTLTYTAPSAGSYTIVAGGMKFTLLTCTNQ